MEEENIFEKQYTNNIDVGIDLENLFENKPHGRAKLKIEEWKKKINYLVNLYNSNAGYKVYNKIK